MAAYCQYAVLELGYKPAEFAVLSQKEVAFIIACIDNRIESEKRALAKGK